MTINTITNTTTKIEKPDLPLYIEVALTMLLEHFCEEEQKHYDEERTTRHVFNALRTVAEWMGWEPE